MCSLGQLRYGNAYSSAAAAQVKYIAAFFKTVGIFLSSESTFFHELQGIFHHSLRILPRYQYLFIDLKGQSHELLSSGYMLKGHSGCTTFNEVEIRLALVILHNLLPSEHQRSPVNALHEAVKLLRIYFRISNACILKLLCSYVNQFLN